MPFAKRLLTLSNRHNLWTVWSDFVTMFACAISNAVDKANFDKREALYLSCAKKYTREELDVFPELIAIMVKSLEVNPFQDFLGSAYMELELGNDHAGQFFTPYDLCEAMARITGGQYAAQILDKGYITVNDCACGAGATMIAACHAISEELSLVCSLNWQNHVMVYAQDIDATVAMMCYIQLSLIGAAGAVKIGDSLCDPMRTGDDQTRYWYTPMYFSPVWSTRRLVRAMDQLMTKEDAEDEKQD